MLTSMEPPRAPDANTRFNVRPDPMGFPEPEPVKEPHPFQPDRSCCTWPEWHPIHRKDKP